MTSIPCAARALAFAIIAIVLAPALCLAAITKGPYIQNVKTGSISVCLESDAPGTATLEYGEDESYGNTIHSEPEDVYIPELSLHLYQHVIPVYGLDRGAEYHYRVALNGETTEDQSLRTAPHNMEPYLWVAMGDSRGGSVAAPNPNHEATVDAIAEWNPDFYFNTGDLVSSGELLEDWEYFFEAEKELMPATVLFPIFGNHEDAWDPGTGLSGEGNLLRLFDLPQSSGAERLYYSFDYGNVHYCVINNENEADLLFENSPERKWIHADLTAAQANPHTNFIFVFHHEPAFSFKDGRQGNWVAKMVLEPIFEQYGVDIVFTGHDHFYARAYLNGREHVVTGGGGAGLYDFVDDVENEPGYRAHDKSYHYCVIQMDPQMAEVTCYRAFGGEVIDNFVVVKDEPPLPYDDDDDDASDDDDSSDDDSDDDSVDDDDQAGDEEDDSAEDEGCCG